MSLKIIATPWAEETYTLLTAQLRQRWGDEFVNKFEAKIEKRIGAIMTSPHIYPVAEENMGLRKCVLHKNCSMLYKVDDEVILIVCFWDNRQDPIIR
jgi:hypothetical protein